MGSKGSTPFSTKFPRDDRTSNDLVSIKNNDPIHILGIFTVLKPVKNSYGFVNCWVPNQKEEKEGDVHNWIKQKSKLFEWQGNFKDMQLRVCV